LTLSEVASVAGARILTGELGLDIEVFCAFGADLMSDVLAYAKPGALLLSGLVNPQVVRTADMADLAAIVFVRGKRPPAETVELARQIGIPLMWAPETMFAVAGKLYQAGMRGCEIP
jgi:predicted transcriptional regulator